MYITCHIQGTKWKLPSTPCNLDPLLQPKMQTRPLGFLMIFFLVCSWEKSTWTFTLMACILRDSAPILSHEVLLVAICAKTHGFRQVFPQQSTSSERKNCESQWLNTFLITFNSLKGPVHTASKEFENAALIIATFRPIVHANPSRKWSFSTTLFKTQWKNLKTPAFHFRVEGKHFQSGAFRKRRISLTECCGECLRF